MFGDLNQLEHGTVLECDLCIIGAGIAGISLARQFINTPYRVTVLESGSTDYEPKIQNLARGNNIGFQYYPLEDSRLRFFGGTTTIWGGRSAQLDAIDFRQRSWVPHSGWPIDLATLLPWYKKARQSMGLGHHVVDEELWHDLKLDAPDIDHEQIRTAFWQFDERHAPYNAERCDDLAASPNIQLLTHATVTRIQSNANGQVIDEVHISDPGSGNRATIRARAFVVAAGGIENARLLLTSNDIQKNGLGNEFDQVGRYFMEHPHARGGRVHSTHMWRLLKLFARSHRLNGQRVAASLRPGEKLQESRGLLNTSFTLACRQHPDERMFMGMRAYQTLKHQLTPTKSNRRMWLATKRLAVWLHERIDPFRPWLLNKLNLRGTYIVVRAEQAPNPSSRVELSSERDELGVPRLSLNWQFSPLDKYSVRETMLAFDHELKRLNLGQVEIAPWLMDNKTEWQVDPLISSHAIGGYHHMGTTRMSAQAQTGVVDSDCKVHGIDNLYIAGSSVFTTSGWANPTLTLTALALRLGEHLKEQLKQTQPAPVNGEDMSD